MKGVILAGGLGTRLLPTTKVVNKHLLQVYDRPMIYFPLMTLVNAGITEIMIVTGEENAGMFVELLSDGKDFGVKIFYGFQHGSGGIAEALGITESFVNNDKVVAILGDNYFEDDITEYVQEFEKIEKGAIIFLKQVEDAKRFGVVELKNNKIVKIVEKPTTPPSNLAVTGLYMYDPKIFDVIRKQVRSGRGELEITDVNIWYAENSILEYRCLKGYWSDMGTPESLLKTANWVKDNLIQKKE